MKIAYLSGNRWPGREPGLSFSLHNARGFAEIGADFTLILPVSGRDALAEIGERFFEGAPMPRIEAVRAPAVGGTRLAFYARAAAHLARTPYDVLVFRALTFLPWAVRLRRWRGLPVWLEAHDFWSDPSLRDEPIPRGRRRHVRLERRFLSRVDGILCVSEPQAELYRRAYPDLPVVAAETGCPPPRPPREPRDPGSPFTLGYVGSLTERKYPLDLVMRALFHAGHAGHAGDGCPRLLCVGARDAAQRERVLAEARELGLEGRVEVHGWAHGAELAALEARMDLGVACLADSFLNRIASPLKVLQYLAAGLPFVATRLPGIERLVTDGREGFLVENDPAAWLGAIERARSDPAGWARMSRACVETARRLAWSERARKVTAALEGHVAPRPAPASV